jgi:hypothetical protein
MKQAIALHISLSVLCFLLVCGFGDFTGYVGMADRDVIITRSSLQKQLVVAAGVGVAFASFAVILLAVSRLFVTAYYPMRLFLALAIGFTTIVFGCGDFKTRLGGPDVYIVMYELPYGPERLLISLGCGMLLAFVTTLVLMRIEEKKRGRGHL